MKKDIPAGSAFLCLVILTVLGMLLNFADLKSQSTLYVSKIDLGKEIFADQIERVVFVTTDLKVYIFSSNEVGRVSGPIGQIYEKLKKEGVDIGEIAVITHNHFSPRRFTPSNNKALHYFQERGFTGKFSIYYPATGKVRTKKNE